MATIERKVFSTNPGYPVLLATFIEHTPLLGSPSYYAEYNDTQLKSDLEGYGIGSSPVKYPSDGTTFFDALPDFCDTGVTANSGPTYTNLLGVDFSVNIMGIL